MKKGVPRYFAKFIEKHLCTQSGDRFCFNKLRREFPLAKFVFATNTVQGGIYEFNICSFSNYNTNVNIKFRTDMKKGVWQV